MQNKFRLYERYNGTFYAQEIETGRRETLKTKDRLTAEIKLTAMNQAASQPAFNREMARVYLRGTDPEFCDRTWKDVADNVARQYDGPIAQRWAKFTKSVPLKQLVRKKLSETGAAEMLAVLNHPKAGTFDQCFPTQPPQSRHRSGMAAQACSLKAQLAQNQICEPPGHHTW